MDIILQLSHSDHEAKEGTEEVSVTEVKQNFYWEKELQYEFTKLLRDPQKYVKPLISFLSWLH